MSEPTLAPPYQELVQFHALVGEESMLTFSISQAEYTGGARGSHCTTGDIALPIASHWRARLNQVEYIPNPMPQMALAIRNSLNELIRATRVSPAV